MLADAERIDVAEDAAYGPDRRGGELPAELTRRQGRLAAIRKATAALEAQTQRMPAPRRSRRLSRGIRIRARSSRLVTRPKPLRLFRIGRSGRLPTWTRGS